jgi:hypothetical protein
MIFTPGMKRKIIAWMLFFVLNSLTSLAQHEAEVIDSVRLDGQVFSAIVQDGDTLILARLDDIRFTSPRSFSSSEEYRKYLRYKKYAVKVYPYAQDAINILKTVEERTGKMKKRQAKKYVKQTYDQLEFNFKTQLKGLTKTQGQILIKMIEKEMNMTFFDIIKEKRNGFTAFYWHQFGKLYDYDLKRGYVRGDDPIMDAVLDGFNLSNYKESSGILLSK